LCPISGAQYNKLVELEPFFIEEVNAQRKSIGLAQMADHITIFRNRENPIKLGMSTRIAGWLVPTLFGLVWLLFSLDAMGVISVNLPKTSNNTFTVLPCIHA